jgi:hypothetical protein
MVDGADYVIAPSLSSCTVIGGSPTLASLSTHCFDCRVSAKKGTCTRRIRLHAVCEARDKPCGLVDLNGSTICDNARGDRLIV